MALSADQLQALGNLNRKKAGEEVDWVNIAAARALTDLGFAERDLTGWKITDDGVAALQEQASNSEPAESTSSVEPFAPRR
jgi:hypothetical protein